MEGNGGISTGSVEKEQRFDYRAKIGEAGPVLELHQFDAGHWGVVCLLYTSDAADE